MQRKYYRKQFGILTVVLFALLLAACGPAESVQPPLPTNTPVPTFTPTPEIVVTPVDPALVATTQAVNAQATADASQASTPAVVEQATQPPTQAEQPTQAAEPTPEPATNTPAPTNPEVVTSQGMNVRGGPGTNYAVVGAATAGQRFTVTGKNAQGDWWQINFNGQSGWVYGPLVTATNTGSVQVAANIPAPPPTATPAPVVPTNTPVPAQPTQPPAPTAPPAPRYKFNIAVVGRCDPNGGVTYVQGRTYVGGTPQSGDWSVAFSYAPDGPIVATVKAGPHAGYEGWDQGFYSHILQADGPREGNWFFWVVDPAGNRISEIANVRTDGSAGDGKCQQAVVDFDSR